MAFESDLPGQLIDQAFQGEEEDVRLGFFASTLDNIPTITTSAGMKSFRAMNTVTGGGWAQPRPGSFSHVGSLPRGEGIMREGFSNNNFLRPRFFFHESGPLMVPKGEKTKYSPFYAATMVNAIGRGFADTPGPGGKPSAFRRLANTSMASGMREKGLLDDSGELISRGSVARGMASSRVGLMTGGQFTKRSRQMARFIDDARPEGAPRLGSTITSSGNMSQRMTATRQALLAGGTGTMSGQFGGLAASTLGEIDPNVRSIGSQSFLQGSARGTQWAQELGIERNAAGRITAREAAKGAGRAAVGKKAAFSGAAKGLALMGGSIATGPAAPIVATVGAAIFAKDVLKLATTGAGHAMETGLGAAKSLQGGLNTGIMEGGFTDNETTLTSRSRGVMAISNSRLNARSVLGHEASAMSQHFG